MKKNSVRVKNKNVRNFSGSPLYSYILETLIHQDWIGEIIINTDSEEIANEAAILSSKVKIHWREEVIRGDEVSMNKIIAHDLKMASNHYILQTHATNPLLTGDTLLKAKNIYLENLKTNQYDSLFSVNQHQSRFYNKQIEPMNHDPENLIPTQDLSPVYEENSCFYFFTKESFEKTHARIGKNPQVFPVPKYEAADIDTEEDFMLAESMMNYRKVLKRQGL